jgi:hypothetical protein
MANLTGTQQGSSGVAVQAALAKEAAARRAESKLAEPSRTSSGYGLPCAKCHLYYPANLDACPTCQHAERVSPNVPKVPQRPVQADAEEIVPDSAVVEHEREEFLRQFKAQLLEAHAEVMTAPESVCKLGEHHSDEAVPAEICTSCYEQLQERVDILEAALHMDLKEATQVVYDAVWADASDPGKTYQNAANALMSELRKRAGITAVLGPFQPVTH